MCQVFPKRKKQEDGAFSRLPNLRRLERLKPESPSCYAASQVNMGNMGNMGYMGMGMGNMGMSTWDAKAGGVDLKDRIGRALEGSSATVDGRNCCTTWKPMENHCLLVNNGKHHSRGALVVRKGFRPSTEKNRQGPSKDAPRNSPGTCANKFLWIHQKKAPST